jgi:Ca2+-binding RTX toxin-like protein
VENLVLIGTTALNGTGNGLANRLTGNGSNNVLLGGAGTDTLLGGAGSDTLDGGAESDRLEGGLGNDTYVLVSTGDTVVEAMSAGMDTVRAGVSYALGVNLENLVLTGSAALNGTGNVLANSLTGNSGANSLRGGDGADRLAGESGADALLGGSGTDRLFGGAGADKLQGGAGVDTVSGGMGNDIFVFASRSEAGDVVTDFRNLSGDDDRFHVSAAAFGGGLVGGQQLSASQFQIRKDNLAQDSNDRFIFETETTKLWFDSNGSATGGLSLVADLQAGATMSAGDIWLI